MLFINFAAQRKSASLEDKYCFGKMIQLGASGGSSESPRPEHGKEQLLRKRDRGSIKTTLDSGVKKSYEWMFRELGHRDLGMDQAKQTILFL